MNSDSTRRFSERVDYYVKARPGYPEAVIDLMRRELELRPEHDVADIGSGTGILTEMLLRNGNLVYAVEPNEAMRRSAEKLLENYQGFRSIDGTAEHTGLPLRSVRFITAGQAFHWFDVARARKEFERILQEEGWVVLMWNDRRHDRPAFSVEYHRIIRAYNTDYDRINHQKVSDDGSENLRAFFGARGFQSRVFDNPQRLDWEGVMARLFSSSYMPMPDDPRAEAMLGELRRAFEQHQSNGAVTLEHDTRVYFGQLGVPKMQNDRDA